MPRDSLFLLYIWLSTDIHKLLLTICAQYISNWNSRSWYIKKLVKHWRTLAYLVFTPLFLLISIALTVTNTFWASLLDFHVGRIDPGTFGVALTSHCCGHSGTSRALSCSISDAPSAAQSFSLSSGSSKSPSQSSQHSVAEILSNAQFSTLSTGLLLICPILPRFNIWVRPPGRSFADKAGGKRDHSENLDAAAPSCWERD